MAMPLILLYEVGIIGATIFSRKASVQKEEENYDADEAQKEDEEAPLSQESENDTETENSIDPEGEEEKY